MLEENFQKTIYDLYSLQLVCEEIVRDAYNGEKIVAPVDIFKILKLLNIEFEISEINIGNMDYLADLQFEITSDENIIKKIILDKDYHNNHSTFTAKERFAIAREVGKVIINNYEYSKLTSDSLRIANMRSSLYHGTTKLVANLDEFQYEMCAIFLLLPMEQLLDELVNHFENDPICSFDDSYFFKEIAKKTEIPFCDLICNYGFLRLCAYQYCKENIADKGVTSPELIKKYGSLFHFSNK